MPTCRTSLLGGLQRSLQEAEEHHRLGGLCRWFHQLEIAPGGRLPVANLRECLAAAIDLTGDSDLGLRAGRRFELADAGPIASAAAQMRSVGAALALESRWAWLLSDAFGLRIVHRGVHTEVRLASTRVGRAFSDYHAAMIQQLHNLMHVFEIPGLQWFFPHRRPRDLTQYEATFGRADLQFSAQFLGYSHDARYLELPLRPAEELDPSRTLQVADCASDPGRITGLVRMIASQAIGSSGFTLGRVARTLGISPRTLVSALTDQGTTFRDVLQDARRELAERYLLETDQSEQEISAQLGLANAEALNQEFRQWTGISAAEFRSLYAHNRLLAQRLLCH